MNTTSSKKRQKPFSFSGSEDEPLSKRKYENKENENDQTRIEIQPFYKTNESISTLISLISNAETSDSISEPSRESSNPFDKEMLSQNPKESNNDAIFSQLDPKHVPDRILFREKEINHIVELLKECYLRKKGENIFLSGQPGTGKTGSVNFILQKLESEGVSFLCPETENHDPNKFGDAKNPKKSLQVFRTNAMGFKSTKDLLVFLYERLTASKETPKKLALEMPELLKRINKQIEEGPFTILFIDEFDTLFAKNQNALEMIELYNSGSKLVLISVSNSIDSIVKLSKKLRMSQNYHHIVFEPYNFNQIYEILKDRISSLKDPSLDGSPFEEQSVLYCAKKLYNLKGSDIRACLDVLLKAAHKMSSKQLVNTSDQGSLSKSKIKIQDLKELCGEAENSEFDGIFATLPINQQVLILALYTCCKQSEHPSIDVKALKLTYNSYCSALHMPKAEIMDILEMTVNFEDYQIIERVLPGKASAKKSIGKLTSPFKDSPGKAMEFKPLISFSQMKQSIQKNEVLARFL